VSIVVDVHIMFACQFHFALQDFYLFFITFYFTSDMISQPTVAKINQ